MISQPSSNFWHQLEKSIRDLNTQHLSVSCLKKHCSIGPYYTTIHVGNTKCSHSDLIELFSRCIDLAIKAYDGYDGSLVSVIYFSFSVLFFIFFSMNTYLRTMNPTL